MASGEQQPYYLSFRVVALERAEKRDPIIRFDAKTSLPNYRNSLIRDIRRTQPEFVKYCDHLIDHCPECFVLPVPPSVSSAGAGTEEDDRMMKERFQQWFDYLSANPVLIRDEETIYFVESDFGYSPVHATGNTQAGLRRKAYKQLAPPPDECQELADLRPIIKAFYKTSGDSAVKLDKMSKARRTLASTENDFGTKLVAFAGLEAHIGMANALRKLGRTIQAASDISSAYSTVECAVFLDALSYVADATFIAKETLTTRQFIIRDYLAGQSTTKSKLATANRLRSGSNIQRVKVDEAIAQLDEARENERALQAKIARVTANILYERPILTSHLSILLKASISSYLLRSIETERRKLATLEVIRMDVRNIDSTGGLSRLGREGMARGSTKEHSTPHSRLGPSQGRESDAWSGLPRRQSGVGVENLPILRSRDGTELDAPTFEDTTDAHTGEDGAHGNDLGYSVDAKSAASLLASSL